MVLHKLPAVMLATSFLVVITASVWSGGSAPPRSAQRDAMRGMKPVSVAQFDRKPCIAQLADGALMAVFVRDRFDDQQAVARLSHDGRNVAVLLMLRETRGICYLRQRSAADRTDTAGFLVESVEADVSRSWPK